MTDTPNTGTPVAGELLEFEPGAQIRAAFDLAERYLRPEIVNLVGTTGRDGDPDANVLVVPKGFELRSVKKFLDEYRDRPERRAGTATLADLDSFIDHARRFSDHGSALFAQPHRQKPRLVAVLDYHEAGADGPPRFGGHQGVYDFPVSDEWRAWAEAEGEWLDQGDFAAFVEDRILDIAPVPEWLQPGSAVAPSAPPEIALRDAVLRLGGRVAGPEKMVELSRGLAIHANAAVEGRVNIDSGEATMRFKTEHVDDQQAPVRVPNLFLVTIPVFLRGAHYLMLVRLRYRVAGSAVKWSVALARAREAFDDAFDEATQRARNETGLPLFLGTPEAAPRASEAARS